MYLCLRVPFSAGLLAMDGGRLSDPATTILAPVDVWFIDDATDACVSVVAA